MFYRMIWIQCSIEQQNSSVACGVYRCLLKSDKYIYRSIIFLDLFMTPDNTWAQLCQSNKTVVWCQCLSVCHEPMQTSYIDSFASISIGRPRQTFIAENAKIIPQVITRPQIQDQTENRVHRKSHKNWSISRCHSIILRPKMHAKIHLCGLKRVNIFVIWHWSQGLLNINRNISASWTANNFRCGNFESDKQRDTPVPYDRLTLTKVSRSH